MPDIVKKILLAPFRFLALLAKGILKLGEAIGKRYLKKEFLGKPDKKTKKINKQKKKIKKAQTKVRKLQDK